MAEENETGLGVTGTESCLSSGVTTIGSGMILALAGGFLYDRARLFRGL